MVKMFIPKRIKVGFVKRDDTFTGKLAYVIYYDEKGKLRKEASWNSWRDKDIETFEFDNTPRNGYIFNKGVQRDGYWGSGRSVIRVYDERDFEFEISVDNLMGLLMHSDVSKRDIVEQCIFAWEGTELVLLPVTSKEYVESVKYTEKQDKKISSKELVEGYTYQAKKSDKPWIYMGYREWFEWENGYELNGNPVKYSYLGNYDAYVEAYKLKGKKHIFYDGSSFFTKTASDLSAVLIESADSNYANLLDKFFETGNSQKIVDVKGADKDTNSSNNYYKNHYYMIEDNYLAIIELKMENNYKNNKYTLRPQIEYKVKNLDYTTSFKMMEKKHRDNKSKVEKIIKLFNEKFAEYFENTHSDRLNKEAEEWLLKNGIYKKYCFVLENGNKVSPYL